MTGFARVQLSSEEGEVLVSVKSVNHRGLDIHFRMPDELDGFEGDLRAAVKRRALRGHFQVRVAFNRSQSASCVLDRGRLESYLAAFGQAAGELGLSAEPDLNAALSLFREAGEAEPAESIRQLLVSAMEAAMDALNEFREREGGELAFELKARAAAIHEFGARIEELRGRALPAFQARLNERLADLLGGTSVEPHRLAQEVAIIADRSDVCEELTRLKIHSTQLGSILDSGGEVGKKMDFLLQEMSREANTILSKTVGIGDIGLGITDLALAAKAEIEKIREQSQNLE